MARKFTPLRTDDSDLSRVQDEIARAVNPALRKLDTVPAVTGSCGGNAALKSLVSALAGMGLITDHTTP
jgi:hypothetical protein